MRPASKRGSLAALDEHTHTSNQTPTYKCKCGILLSATVFERTGKHASSVAGVSAYMQRQPTAHVVFRLKGTRIKIGSCKAKSDQP